MRYGGGRKKEAGKTYELVFVTGDVRDIHVVGGRADVLLQTQVACPDQYCPVVPGLIGYLRASCR